MLRFWQLFTGFYATWFLTMTCLIALNYYEPTKAASIGTCFLSFCFFASQFFERLK